MVRRKSSLFIAAVLCIFSFAAITWLSCNKGGVTPVRCEGVVCENGGYCYVDTTTKKTKCSCPTGTEGANCAIVSVDKYVGNWSMRQIITELDSLGTVTMLNDTSYFALSIAKSATPTTFFINNFDNNPYYNNIICALDSVNSSIFYIDSISDAHMIFSSFKLKPGGYGGFTTVGDTVITGTFTIRKLSSTYNWMDETILFKLTRQ